MYLGRIVQRPSHDSSNDALTTLHLKWYIQAVSSLSTKNKAAVGPFVQSSHIWKASLSEIMFIPPTYEPIIQLEQKKISKNY